MVDKLVADHALITSILGQVRDLAASAAGSGGAALEAIGRALDALPAGALPSSPSPSPSPGPDWPAAVFRLSATD